MTLKYGIHLILLIFIISFSSTTKRADIAFDSFGYYFYLPATFLIKDIQLRDFGKVKFIYKQVTGKDALYQVYKVKDNDNCVIRYPMGLAISYSPGFFAGYILSKITDTDLQDGFNAWFRWSVIIWSLLITLIGIWALHKFLLYYVNAKIALLSMTFLVFGTNYLFHSHMSAQGLMSHNYLFTYYSLLLLATRTYFISFKIRYLSLILILCSLITLVRNSDIFCFLIPLIYGISKIQRQDLPKLHTNLVLKYSLAIIPSILLLSLQLLYWKLVTGSWIYDSYQDNPGQCLDFKQPYILESLFSFRKGLFIYTPISLFFIIGFYFLVKNCQDWFKSIGIFSIVNIYVIISWTCWWYSDSFGHRAMIPNYVLWSLGFSFLLSASGGWRLWLKIIMGFILTASLVLNVFQIWQIRHGIMEGNNVTRDYYLSTFGQTKPPSVEQRSLLLPEDDPEIKDTLPEYFHGKVYKEMTFNLGSPLLYISENLNYLSDSSRPRFKILNAQNSFSEAISIPNQYLNNADYKWIRLKAQMHCKSDTSLSKILLAAHMENKGKIYRWKVSKLSNTRWEKDGFFQINFWYMVEKVQRNKDIFKAFCWNQEQTPVEFISLTAEIYSPYKSQSIFLWD
ncbi:MAG: hypothetical protein IPP06_10390 [Saprospiraceae bacterium]|nr:hypothetical protein [Candidatus Vicinibacter affinis]MBP6172998.1 hypothetical protein [Saprospiraceae bacterium]MBK6572886.1 hypothetical protein [Candidatus Vicinibacter affinis]MBK7695942.1 hypothetical protein [Candidatus Vicinibacter affinis]MBK7798534.1 hypothetical protein [Candidatus Vicinibacter affinis]